MKKKIIIVSLIAAIVFVQFSCKKEKPFQSNAEIIGYDMRSCPAPCCGGLQIVIDNIPYTGTNSFSLIYSLPAGFSLPNNTTFPVAVKVDYKTDKSRCSGNYVAITRIETR